MNNVIFCNWTGEIRETKSEEISHIIKIRNNNGTLYCYIELFNVLCAYIKLYDNCKEDIDIDYHQDAITGERFKESIELNLDSEPTNKNDVESFDILANNMFQRIREREFRIFYKRTFQEIMDDADKEVKEGKLAKENLAETCLERCCNALASLSVDEFPYLIEDFKDEENPEMNYIHSNLQESQFENFCELNKLLNGISVLFPEGDEYIMDGFQKIPFLVRNGITLVKVFCVLRRSTTSQRKYIPYKQFFEGLRPNGNEPSNRDGNK